MIKPPALLEIWGPLMMSYAAVSHLQYRLTAEGGGTRLAFVHRAIGMISDADREGLPKGWAYWIEQMRERAEGKKRKGK